MRGGPSLDSPNLPRPEDQRLAASLHWGPFHRSNVGLSGNARKVSLSLSSLHFPIRWVFLRAVAWLPWLFTSATTSWQASVTV